jgi:hypothetical protein
MPRSLVTPGISPRLPSRFRLSPLTLRSVAAGLWSMAILATSPVHAAGSSMPWEEPASAILESIEGPVAKIIAVIIIIVTGLTLAFGDTSGGSPADPDRVRAVDRLRRLQLLLPELLLVRRRSAGLMETRSRRREPPGIAAPVHRALTEPILLAGAPRAIAICQRHAGRRGRARPAPLAGRVCSGSAIGHGRRSGPPAMIPQFFEVGRRHMRYPPICALRLAMMLDLREYRPPAPLLCDFLPWAALIAPGVVLNKDGSFQRTAGFPGTRPGLGDDAEVAATRAPEQRPASSGSGWAIFIEAQRDPAMAYPTASFPIRSRPWSTSSGGKPSWRRARISRVAIS